MVVNKGKNLRKVRQFAALAAVLFLAACGSGGVEDSSSLSSGGMEEVLPSPLVVSIGRLICGGHLPLAVVEKKFQQELPGLRLQTVQNHNWDDVVEDLESGSMHGTFILSPLAMKLIRDGLAARIVLLANRNGNGFVLSGSVASIPALGERRAIIAVPHLYSQQHVLLHRLLRQKGVDEAAVSVVAMPPRDMISSLRRGEIDGFVVGEPEAHKSVELGVGWMASISPQIWPNHMDHVLLVSERFISKHPRQLQQLVTALVKSGRFIEAHPQEAARMGEDYTGSSAKVFAQVLSDPPDWIDYSDMVPTTEDVRLMGQQLVEMGLWRDLPADLPRYIDDRFVKQAAGAS